LRAVEQAIGVALRTVAVACLVGIMLLMVAGVGNRFFPLGSLDWSDEIIELMLVWLIFAGSAEVWRLNQHFAVEIVPLWVGGTRFDKAYRAFIAAACLVFIAIFTYKSLELFLRADDLSPYFSWSRRLWYGAMPFNGLLMTAFSLRQLFVILAGMTEGKGDLPRPAGS
jgi:TRAP-type transport system small permease protein